MLFIGLTGSIATGKSTVANLFKELGCYIIDADKIAHDAYKKDTEAYSKIIKRFGDNILSENGDIDRKKLGSIVLKDRNYLSDLEKIVHPEVERIRNAIINNIQIKDRHAIIIYDVPLLFEKHLEHLFDFTIVVYTDTKTQLKRLMQRNNISEYEANKRVKLQIPIDNKIKLADFVIDNSKTIDFTKKQVDKLFFKLKELESERI